MRNIRYGGPSRCHGRSSRHSEFIRICGSCRLVTRLGTPARNCTLLCTSKPFQPQFQTPRLRPTSLTLVSKISRFPFEPWRQLELPAPTDEAIKHKCTCINSIITPTARTKHTCSKRRRLRREGATVDHDTTLVPALDHFDIRLAKIPLRA